MKWKKISTQFLSILIAALMLIGSFPVGLQTADAATEMTLAQMRATDVYKAVKSLNSSADFTDAGKNNPGQTSYVQTFYCHCGFANCISAHGAVKNTNAMCCASFVNYYLWNTSAYGGTDKGITWRCKPSDTGQDPHTQRIGVGSVWYSLEKATEDASTGWYYAYDANPTEVNGMDYSGVAKDYANGLLYYQPGDIIIFSDSQYIYYHAAVYAGYYNGQHWIAHCTASNGGGVMLSPFNGYSIVKSNTTVYASKIFSPYYKGAIEVYKTDASTGSGLAGAEFTVRNSAGRIVATIGPTNKNGYAITSGGTSDPLLEFGTYTVTETVFPSGYESNGATSWTVTINQNSPLKSNAYVGTLNVKNKRSVGTIGVKKNDSNGSPLANVVFGVYSDSACKTLVGKMTTNSNGISAVWQQQPITSKRSPPQATHIF